MLRPERIRLGDAAGARAAGTVAEVQFFGAFTRVRVDAGGAMLQADLPDARRARRPRSRATPAHLHWDDAAVHMPIELKTRHDAMSSGQRCHGADRRRPARRLSDLLYTRRGLLLLALLAPPLLWFGVIYLGLAVRAAGQRLLPARRFHRAGRARGRPDELRRAAGAGQPGRGAALDRDGRWRSRWPAPRLAFPVAYVMARHARGATKALLYIAVMLPLWSSYLVRLYAWKLLLAKEGAICWVAERAHTTGVLEALLATPAIGGPSLSFSTIGTFIVFVYMWLPFMILPLAAALERIPGSMIEASGDLGAGPGTTFRRVILPLAMPGVAAGSIFTFSLTLGDYIIPQVIGDSTLYIGQVVYRQQGVAGNLPFAAAFSLVPIVVIGLYLWFAKRQGAFDAL